MEELRQTAYINSFEKKRKERTGNWQDAEINALLKEIEENKHSLFAPLSQEWTNKHKTAVWKGIARAINACGNKGRDYLQVRKRWTNMRASALSRERARQNTPTGCGLRDTESVTDAWWMDAVLGIIGKGRWTASATGINPPDCKKESSNCVLQGDTYNKTSHDETLLLTVEKNEEGCNGDDGVFTVGGELREGTQNLPSARGANILCYSPANNTDAYSTVRPEPVLMDLISRDLPHGASNKNGSTDVCFAQTSTPLRSTNWDHQPVLPNEIQTTNASASKRASSLDSSCLTLAKKAQTTTDASASDSTTEGPRRSARATKGHSSNFATAWDTCSPVFDDGGPSAPRRRTSTPRPRPGELRQLLQKGLMMDSSQSARKSLEQLMDMEVKKLKTEHEYFRERLALTRIQRTNAEMEQLKLYYEIKKMENDLDVPAEKRCNKIFPLDIEHLKIANT